MTQEEEFEFRLRLEREKKAPPAATQSPLKNTDTAPTWMERTVAPFLAQKFAEFRLDKVPARGVLQGASDAPIGAAQLLTNLVGQGDSTNQLVKERERKYEEQRGSSNFDWARLAGNVIGPANLIAAGPAAASTAGRIGQGMKIGAASGATNPMEEFGFAEKAGQVGLGGVMGGVIPAGWEGAKAVGRVTRNVIDPILPGGAQRAAGRLASTVSGDKRNDVIQALLKAEAGQTAGQAAVPSGSAEFAALQKLAAEAKPSTYLAVENAQEGARKAALGTIGQTKDALKAAVAERGGRAAQNYGAAYQQVIKADPELAQISANPYFQKALPTALDLAKASKLDPKKNLTEFLQMVKIGIDKQLTTTGDTALANAEKAAAMEAKSQLVGWLGKKNPAFETARSTFAADSKPINQMQVGQYLQDKLVSPLENVERSASFAQAMRDAPGTIKRSSGQSMYDDLGQVLTPEQLGTANKVLGGLKTEAAYKDMASKGMPATRQITGDFADPVRPPGLLSRVATVTNAVLSRIEGKGSKATMNSLADLMTDPAKTAKVMQAATPMERKLIVDELMKLQAAGMGQQP